MPNIPIVENPRRRRRHSRRLTPAQLRAGFGGKSHMSGGRRHRRRNPALMSLAGNPRRRRRHHRRSAGGFTVRHSIVRRRNPGMLGGITKYFDLKGAAYVAGGIILARSGPKMIQKVWAGAPTTGIGLYALQLGSAVVGAVAVRMLLKSEKGAEQVATGGIGYVLYSLANDYVLPKIGLSGLAAPSNQWLSYEDVQRMSGVRGVHGYRLGTGSYVPASTPTLGRQVLPEFSV